MEGAVRSGACRLSQDEHPARACGYRSGYALWAAERANSHTGDDAAHLHPTDASPTSVDWLPETRNPDYVAWSSSLRNRSTIGSGLLHPFGDF
jgi:hypothetical protein